MKLHWPLFLHLFLLLQLLPLNEGSSPLCITCPCNSEPNAPPVVNCNAIQANLFDKSFWIDEHDQTYPMSSLFYTNNRLERLNETFWPSNLTLLDLSNDSIEEIGSAVFQNLQQLEDLILADNLLENIQPDCFKGIYTKGEYFPLRKLKSLDLSNNKLRTLDADIFEHIDELEILVLSSNPLGAIDDRMTAAIASLVKLKKLDLSYTGLTTLPENFLTTPKSLVSLDLSGNSFAKIPKALDESHVLEILNLDENPITDLSGLTIKTLTTLQLSGLPALKEIGPGDFGNLESLQELQMCKCKSLEYIHPNAFLNLEGNTPKRIPLKKILLSDNNLTSIDERLFSFEENTIELSGNPWKCNCANEWMVNVMTPYLYERDMEQVLEWRCAEPEEYANRLLHDLYIEEAIRCVRNEPDNAILWAIVVTGGTVVVFLVLGLLYMYKIRHFNRNVRLTFTHPQYVKV